MRASASASLPGTVCANVTTSNSIYSFYPALPLETLNVKIVLRSACKRAQGKRNLLLQRHSAILRNLRQRRLRLSGRIPQTHQRLEHLGLYPAGRRPCTDYATQSNQRRQFPFQFKHQSGRKPLTHPRSQRQSLLILVSNRLKKRPCIHHRKQCQGSLWTHPTHRNKLLESIALL